MIAASVSLSPIVVAISVAENQVQYRISTKILADKIKQDAELASKIVTGITATNNQSNLKSSSERIIDFRV